MVRSRTSNPFIDPFKSKENYKNYVTVDLSNRGDFSSIQSAIDSIVDAAIDNKYAIHVFGTDYNENVSLNKPYISLGFEPSVRLISDLNDTLVISNNDEKHYGLIVKSNSPVASDNALKMQGTGEPRIIDAIIESTSAATALKVNDNIDPILHEVIIDSSGDGLVVLGNNKVRYESGEISSGFGKQDLYVISTSEIELGNVSYARSKANFLGTKTLIKKAENVAVDNSVLEFPSNPANVEDALKEIFSGKFVAVTLGENVDQYDALYMDNGKAYIASRDDVGKIDVIGLASESGIINEQINVYQDDIITNPLWSFNTTRKTVYLGLNGTISDTAPISTGNAVVELGSILEADKIRFFLGGNKVIL